mmetsp:Transcript_24872/g.35720  ORF Transcript_24872/g.35720 Transcript_24872/m.35720 type:complete len:154 (+) Transcript_24872:420-881(+)
MGCGSGSLGVTRSYIVEQVLPKERTNILAIMTTLQYAGFTISPIIGAYLGLLGSTSNMYWEFALPAYFMALLSFYSILALMNIFKDISNEDKNEKKKNQPLVQQPFSTKSIESAFVFTLILRILLNITTKGSIAVYETFGAQAATVNYLILSV